MGHSQMKTLQYRATKNTCCITACILIGVVLNNLLILAIIYGSRDMGKSTDAMYHLSVDMNASTSEMMSRAKVLVGGITPDDITMIVSNVRKITTNVEALTSGIASDVNTSALIDSVELLLTKIDMDSISAIVDSVSSISGTVAEHNISGTLDSVTTLINEIDPVLIHDILGNMDNITKTTLEIVSALAASHNLQVKF